MEKCLRFPLNKLRLFSGLNSGGVRGIKLEKNNYIISLSVLKHSFIVSRESEKAYY